MEGCRLAGWAFVEGGDAWAPAGVTPGHVAGIQTQDRVWATGESRCFRADRLAGWLEEYARGGTAAR